MLGETAAGQNDTAAIWLHNAAHTWQGQRTAAAKQLVGPVEVSTPLLSLPLCFPLSLALSLSLSRLLHTHTHTHTHTLEQVTLPFSPGRLVTLSLIDTHSGAITRNTTLTVHPPVNRYTRYHQITARALAIHPTANRSVDYIT